MSLIPAPHRTAPHHRPNTTTALITCTAKPRRFKGTRQQPAATEKTHKAHAHALRPQHTHTFITRTYTTHAYRRHSTPRPVRGPRQAFRFARAQSFIWHCFAVSLCIAHPPWTRLALQASRFLHVYPVRILSAHPPFALSTPCAGSSPSPQGIVEEQRKRTKRKKKKR